MAGHRIKRINEQLKREISEILYGEVSDPRIGAVTVTAVVTAPDLTLARVRVLLQGSAEEQEESLEGLAAASSFIRAAIGRRVELRRVPELRFEQDRSMEHAMKIERILAEVLPDEGQADEQAAEEEPPESAGGADAGPAGPGTEDVR